ncbi:hypothetical protein DERP_010618 [Dermatophagoides pteronyssinus]|uniref:Uncharacterized protein n=1 Tax=Dermatophagoides pteronyssinus TaxID=6956 RepID=A0ABQ8J9Y8_DERPT|nr:hypothetical protein DERP_010618 [Dermatophagoides pteronyssinus]
MFYLCVKKTTDSTLCNEKFVLTDHDDDEMWQKDYHHHHRGLLHCQMVIRDSQQVNLADHEG